MSNAANSLSINIVRVETINEATFIGVLIVTVATSTPLSRRIIGASIHAACAALFWSAPTFPLRSLRLGEKKKEIVKGV